MAAPTVTLAKHKNIDNKHHVQVLYTPSTSYLTATPSETVPLARLGLKNVESVYQPTRDILDPSIPLTDATTKRGYSVTMVDHAVGETAVNLRLWETDGVEVADSQNKSTKTTYLVFVGT